MKNEKIVLVTGISSGIGKSVARKYYDEGYTVCGIDRIGNDDAFESYICDISNEIEIENIIRTISQKHHELHYVINCAGIFFSKSREPIENLALSEIKEVLETNVIGTMIVTKHVIPLLKKAVGDRGIINISSDQAYFPRKKNSIYAMSKGGIESFSHACAVELIEHNIRVNTVLPASVRTNFINKMVSDEKEAAALFEKQNQIMPLGVIEPDEVAELVYFLGSERSKKITGQSIMIDSGLYI